LRGKESQAKILKEGGEMGKGDKGYERDREGGGCRQQS
jgi:hypothetical protein